MDEVYQMHREGGDGERQREKEGERKRENLRALN